MFIFPNYRIKILLMNIRMRKKIKFSKQLINILIFYIQKLIRIISIKFNI